MASLEELRRELAALEREELDETRDATRGFSDDVYRGIFDCMQRQGLMKAACVCPEWRDLIEGDEYLAERLHEPMVTVHDALHAIRQRVAVDPTLADVIAEINLTRVATRTHDAALPHVLVHCQAFPDGTTSRQHYRVAPAGASAVESPGARRTALPPGALLTVASGVDPGLQVVLTHTQTFYFFHERVGEFAVINQRCATGARQLATLSRGGMAVSVLKEPLRGSGGRGTAREPAAAGGSRAHAAGGAVEEEAALRALKEECRRLESGGRRSVAFTHDTHKQMLLNGVATATAAAEYVATRWVDRFLRDLGVDWEGGFTGLMAALGSVGWPFLWPDTALLEVTEERVRAEAVDTVYTTLSTAGDVYAPHSAKVFLLVLNTPCAALACALVDDGCRGLLTEARARAAGELRHHTAPFMVEQLGLSVYADAAATQLEALFRGDDLLWQYQDTIALG